MFTLDFQIAKKELVNGSQDIIMFLVLVDGDRKLPVYTVTTSSIVEICENIVSYRKSLVDVVSIHGFHYDALIGLSYAQ